MTSGFSQIVSAQQLRDFDCRRLRMVSAGVLGCCIVGGAYGVSIMLHALQAQFGVSQKAYTTISSVGYLFQFFTLPAGWVMDRYGPSTLMAGATLMCSAGWLLFALTFAGVIEPSVVNLTLVNVGLVMFTGYFDPPTNLNACSMFPLNRGQVVMIQKTFMGLSVALVSLTHAAATAQPSQQPADSTTMLHYTFMFSGITLLWGGAGVLWIREAPTLTATRQATYFEGGGGDDIVAPCTTTSGVANDDDDDDDDVPVNAGDGGEARDRAGRARVASNNGATRPRLLSLRDAQLIAILDRSTVEELGEDDGDGAADGNASSDAASPLSPAVEAALATHVPADPRVMGVALALLLFNVSYLSVASAVLLYAAPLSRAACVLLAIGGHAAVLSFFVLPALRYYAWPPTRGVRVTFLAEGDTAVPVSALSDAAAAAANDDVEMYDDVPGERQQRPQSYTRLQMVFPAMHTERFTSNLCTSADLWLLFFSVAAVWGSGSTVIANVIQLFDALAGDHARGSQQQRIIMMQPSQSTSVAASVSGGNRPASLCVAVMGVGSAVGRIVAGSLDGALLTPHRLSTTVLLPLPPLIMALASVLALAVDGCGAVWVFLPFFLNSFAYGSSWAITLLVVRQMFSVDTGQHYMFLFVSGASSVVFGRAVLGPSYDRELQRQHAPPGQCIGVACVDVVFWTIAAACTCSTLLSVAVHLRWMRRNGLRALQSLP